MVRWVAGSSKKKVWIGARAKLGKNYATANTMLVSDIGRSFKHACDFETWTATADMRENSTSFSSILLIPSFYTIELVFFR